MVRECKLDGNIHIVARGDVMSDSIKIDQIVPLLIEQSKHLRELNEKLSNHIASEDTAIKSLLRAFPDGDIDGHQSYHALLIKKEEARAAFRKAVIEKTLVGVLTALLIATIIGTVTYVRNIMPSIGIIKSGG